MYPLRMMFIAWLTLITLLFATSTYADVPSRVARLSLIVGTVSFAPAGEEEWVGATRNWPVSTGDRLWCGADSRAELQMGAAVIRLAANTNVNWLNLDDKTIQVQLTEGRLHLHVRKLAPNQTYEVDTPNLAFTVTQPGDYRLVVDENGDATTISVFHGQGIAYGETQSKKINKQESYRFTGTDLSNEKLSFETDDFDRWSFDRDRSRENLKTARHVSRDVIGYEDLEGHGEWRTVATYGDVWFPTVEDDWAPYRYGHWAWIDSWGWTWIDNEPWGFAPSHYGRWEFFENHWCWIPGSRSAYPVYAPALVIFIGGDDFDIGWFPLGYNEVYWPPYSASAAYFITINIGNTRLPFNQVRDTYRRGFRDDHFRNRNTANAITAVSNSSFLSGQAVNKAAIKIPPDQIGKGRITRNAPLAPRRDSLIGGAKKTSSMPSEKALSRSTLAKSKPPAEPLPFNAKQEELAKTPGKPFSASERTSVKPNERIHQIKPSKPISQPSLIKPERVMPTRDEGMREFQRPERPEPRMPREERMREFQRPERLEPRMPREERTHEFQRPVRPEPEIQRPREERRYEFQRPERPQPEIQQPREERHQRPERPPVIREIAPAIESHPAPRPEARPSEEHKKGKKKGDE